MNKFLAIFALIGAASAGAPIGYSGGIYGGAVASYGGAIGYSQPLLRQQVAVAQPILRQQVAIAQPIVQKAVAVRQEPYDPHPQYNYGYSVSDALTGDQKQASETRDGDVVKDSTPLLSQTSTDSTLSSTVKLQELLSKRSLPQSLSVAILVMLESELLDLVFPVALLVDLGFPWLDSESISLRAGYGGQILG
ncbi:Larval cuticle protein A3A [Orchesella cincta]|uniref:Larval cuticle protein A3A n=1 Tax=Orchesella cincta TaxID=48709 RepID=A0A1D2MQA7_ORCCI|nr:Larval cuticle protein A3A [Orchesella cincta]